MLNTKKFLYIMPDCAYVAELLPTKKEHVFGLQVFRQVNGEFITDEELIADNIEKLIKKIDPDEYFLILPDFLFTNTIVDVAETSESEVKKYLKETLLPSLDLTKETHELSTCILTEHHGKTKVQLSAIEKSLLDPIRKACGEQNITITDIAPLTWTMKSSISLEPSVSAIQIGKNLYVAEHYIGVDQTVSFQLSELENIVDTVKTLKGTEPNIQTLYLVTDAQVEKEIKKQLGDTLPIQQLATAVEEKDGVPAHIQQVIESAARTLDISDFPVPRFALGKYIAEAKEEKAEATEKIVEESAPETEESTLPEPIVPAPKPPTVEPLRAEIQPLLLDEEDIPEFSPFVPPAKVSDLQQDLEPEEVLPKKTPTPPESTSMLPLDTMQESHDTKPYLNSPMPDRPVVAAAPAPTKVIIKNKSGVGSLLKVIAITLGALIITVVVGIGIGFGLLSYGQKSNPLDSNSANPSSAVTASSTPSATPSPTPTPTPVPTTAAKDKVKILVVNATKTAGKAGSLKSKLTTAGYKSVETGNAQGTYATAGTFVLMTAEDKAFISTLAKDSGLTLTYQADKETEDAKAAYDIVIVMNE